MLKHILWAAIGAGAGYYVAKKHLEADFDSRLQSEVEKTRTFYKNMYDEKLRRATEVSHNEGAIQAVIDITGGEESAVMINEKYKPSRRVEIPDDVELLDIVSAHPDIPEEPEEEEMPDEAVAALVNYQGISTASAEPVGNISRILERKVAEEEELAYVKPDGPRIIDFKAYDENGGDYKQDTVVFYAKDSIVSNERDEKLTEDFVGTHISYANLAKLNDETTTIYIRDDKNGMDHEVIRSASSYAVDVLGQQPE